MWSAALLVGSTVLRGCTDAKDISASKSVGAWSRPVKEAFILNESSPKAENTETVSATEPAVS